MLTAIFRPSNDHDTATPADAIPRLATPAAIPQATLGLVGAVRQRARRRVLARGWRIRHPLLRKLGAGLLPIGIGAVVGLGVNVLAGELVGYLVAHGLEPGDVVLCCGQTGKPGERQDVSARGLGECAISV